MEVVANALAPKVLSSLWDDEVLGAVWGALAALCRPGEGATVAAAAALKLGPVNNQ